MTVATEAMRQASESKNRRRLAHIGLHPHQGILNPMYGKHQKLSTKLLISEAHRKLHLTREELNVLYSSGLSTSAIANQYNVSSECVRWWMKKYGITRREPSKGNLGKKFSLEHRLKISLNRITHGLSKGSNNPMAKEENVARYFASCAKRPTKPERIVWDILDTHFPGTFRYNGDFSQKVMINGLIPDFVNIDGKKQAVEVFGDYFHNPKLRNIKWNRTEKGRVEAFAQLGWDCLIIWERELRDEALLTQRIMEFIG